MYSWVQQLSAAEVKRSQAVWFDVRMRPDPEPVWPEDEEVERIALARAQGAAVEAASDREADEMTRGLTVRLPDRLLGGHVWLAPDGSFDATDFDYYAFSVEPTFAAPPDIALRRMSLALELTAGGDAGSPHASSLPVACLLLPRSDWTEKRIHIADVNVDVWKMFAGFFPLLPADAASVKLDCSLGWTTSHPRIQCTGTMTHQPLWMVADDEVRGSFVAYVLAQVPRGVRLQVTAGLHVELRKRLLGAIRRSYAKNATPLTYLLHEPGEVTRNATLVVDKLPAAAELERAAIDLFSEAERRVRN